MPQLILDNPAPELVTICDRVANAVTVFGMDGLVMRLWPIVGSQSGEAGWGAQGGVSMGATSFRSLRTQGSGGRSHHGAAAVSRVGAKANFHSGYRVPYSFVVRFRAHGVPCILVLELSSCLPRYGWVDECGVLHRTVCARAIKHRGAVDQEAVGGSWGTVIVPVRINPTSTTGLIGTTSTSMTVGDGKRINSAQLLPR